MTDFKMYARFSADHLIQMETRRWHEFPTDNTEDGSEWFEVPETFTGERHMTYNDGSPRLMTDEEHAGWQAGINLSGALNVGRAKRSQLLKLSDWVETSSMSDEKKEEWRVYRQALRDLPETITDYDIVYPTEPTL
jgi:hypothetical protein